MKNIWVKIFTAMLFSTFPYYYQPLFDNMTKAKIFIFKVNKMY